MTKEKSTQCRSIRDANACEISALRSIVRKEVYLPAGSCGLRNKSLEAGPMKLRTAYYARKMVSEECV